MYMPVKVKVKKSKKVNKKEQKQSQTQIVNIKLGGRRRATKGATAIPKPLAMYQAIGSMPFQNMGVGAEPKRSLLAERPEVRQPQGIEQPLQLEGREPVRENLLGGATRELPREDIRQRRISRLSQPEVPSMFQDFPPPPLDILVPPPPLDILVPPPPLEALGGGGAILEDFPPPERFPTLGQERTSPARETRRVLQISEGAGSNVPLELLIKGKYNLEGEPRRTQPTVNQRERLIEAGYQVKEATPKKKKGKKDA
jgi:hypothetical protein